MTQTQPSRPILTLRAVGLDDIPTIRVLAERIWRVSYATMLPPAQIDYMLGWMYGADRIAAELTAGVLWRLALLDGAPVGYLSVTIEDRDTAELNKLYLRPDLQGRGLGQILLDQAASLAADRGCSMLRLRVNKTNARALRAYRRAGFNEIGALVADIGGGFVMDDYILARPVAVDPASAQRRHTAGE